ncbi:MAG: hypothetical protein EOM50_15590 [Erysipelotrichia bacterium]|nr:hypothetical protein [Erysipelotrichia bacterium]NCC54213.1 hypothetical protein [Erysipelotrichia bacterium]
MAKNTTKSTMAKIVMDVFLKHNATSPETAIKIDAFKDVKLTASVISYTIANFMQDDIVLKTEDDRYYFDQVAWKKMEKKVMRGYWMLIALPLIVLLVLLLVTHWGDLRSAFFR